MSGAALLGGMVMLMVMLLWVQNVRGGRSLRDGSLKNPVLVTWAKMLPRVLRGPARGGWPSSRGGERGAVLGAGNAGRVGLLLSRARRSVLMRLL